MFGHTATSPFEKAVENIFNNFASPTWQQEFNFSNPFNDTNLDEKTLSIALPGFSKKEIEINVDGDLLIISSEVKPENETKFKKSFKRSFRLVKDIDVDSISATMENGILTISFDRKNVTKTVKIS